MSEHTTIWRLVHKRHAETAYTTHEPYKFPGRHTPRNTSAIYAAESPSQAILETLLHLGDPELLQQNYLLVPAQIPKSAIHSADQFTRNLLQRHLALRLPASTPSENLILLNSSHQDFSLLKIGTPTKLERERESPQLTASGRSGSCDHSDQDPV